MLSPERILVTGGAGFVGSHLICHLVEKHPSAAILSLDCYFTGTPENHFRHPNVRYHAGYTQEINRMAEMVDFAPQIVYHLGEYSRIVKSFDDIDLCHSSNIRGTFEVLQFCRPGAHSTNGSKLVYAASSSKFGNNGADEHLSPYAWMKAKNVELIKNFASWFGLDFAITYFFNVYGPGHIRKGDYATVIGIFEQCVLDGRPIPVVAPGTQRRDFTHVHDIVRGVALAGEKGAGDGYLLGTGNNHTIIEVAEAFEHPYEIVPERKGERFSGQAYPSKAEEELGWSAEHDVLDYIREWKRTNIK